MLCQEQYVFAPLPQRRNDDRKGIEAEVQVFPELPIPHHLLQVAVRRRNHPDVDLLHRVGADFLYFPRLQGPQQFGLHEQRHFADFVEEDGAAVGQLKLPGLAALGRAGKRAGRIAEELAFHEAFRNGRAVYVDKGTPPLAAEAQNPVDDDFLACAAFPFYQDSRVGRRHELRQPQAAQELGAVPDDMCKFRRQRMAAVGGGLEDRPAQPLSPFQLLMAEGQLRNVFKDRHGPDDFAAVKNRRNINQNLLAPRFDFYGKTRAGLLVAQGVQDDGARLDDADLLVQHLLPLYPQDARIRVVYVNNTGILVYNNDAVAYGVHRRQHHSRRQHRPSSCHSFCTCLSNLAGYTLCRIVPCSISNK